jgi:hypothetical protein
MVGHTISGTSKTTRQDRCDPWRLGDNGGGFIISEVGMVDWLEWGTASVDGD